MAPTNHVCNLSGFNPMRDPPCPACHPASVQRLIDRYRQVNGHIASDGYEDRDEDEVVASALAEYHAELRRFFDAGFDAAINSRGYEDRDAAFEELLAVRKS